jgi:hypothetical protein
LRTELENRNGEIAKLGNECKVLNEETAVMGRELEALYTSSSWRLTRPLRVLKHGAIRLRRRKPTC